MVNDWIEQEADKLMVLGRPGRLLSDKRDDIASALRAAYARPRAEVLDAITSEGPNGEIYNSYHGGEDLREFLT